MPSLSYSSIADHVRALHGTKPLVSVVTVAALTDLAAACDLTFITRAGSAWSKRCELLVRRLRPWILCTKEVVFRRACSLPGWRRCAP